MYKMEVKIVEALMVRSIRLDHRCRWGGVNVGHPIISSGDFVA